MQKSRLSCRQPGLWKFLSEKALFGHLPLAIAAKHCYNFLGKQKCGSLRVLAHPQACAGVHSPTQRSMTAPHGILYATAALFTREVLCAFHVFVRARIVLSRMRCVGVYPAQRFCFHPASGGSFSFYLSSDRRGENTRKEKRGRILETACALSTDGAQKQYQESYTGEFEIWKVKSDPIRPGWLL